MSDYQSDKQFQFASPIFRVPNAVAAAEYYVSVFGFTYDWGFGDPPTFTAVTRESVKIFFNQISDQSISSARKALNTDSADLYIFVRCADDVYEELKSRGAELLAEPKTYDYGMRDFSTRDLNGYVLTFGHDASGSTEQTDS